MAFSFGVFGFRAALSDLHTEFSVLFWYLGFQWWFSPLITSQPTRPMPNDLRWGGLITVARLTVACILLGFGTLYVVHTINLSDLVLNCNLASIFWSLFWKGSKTGSWHRSELSCGVLFVDFACFPGPNKRAGICSCSRNEAICWEFLLSAILS